MTNPPDLSSPTQSSNSQKDPSSSAIKKTEDVVQVALQAFSKTTQHLQDAFDKQVGAFSHIGMGSRLFTVGFWVLIFDIVVRILQWIILNVRYLDNVTIATSLDDVFFIGLLVISMLMMTGGLAANIYLIWSMQRNQREDALIVQETLETDSRLQALEKARSGSLGEKPIS